MKKLLSVILSFFLIVSLFNSNIYADGAPAAAYPESKAHILYHLGLFKGISNEKIDFALKKNPTRLECLVMLVRLMGEEEEALSYKGEPSSFKDVPNWGKPYVDYAYSKGYTKGVSKDKFLPNSLAGSNDYETFVLRALGYTDSGKNPDFSYEKAYRFASEKRIHFDEFNESAFTREEAVFITEAALHAELKEGGGMSLIQKLYDKGVISTYQIYSVGCEPYSEGKGPKDCKVKIVSTVEELLNSVSDDTVLVLKPGVYDISAYVKKHYNSLSFESGKNKKSVSLSHFVEFKKNEYDKALDLFFVNLKNFHMLSADKEKKAELVYEPGFATVLSFNNCKDSTISNISIGHYPEGTCLGDVLRVENGENFAVVGNDLYGCGSIGLLLINTNKAFVYSNYIHDCTHSGISLDLCQKSKIILNKFHKIYPSEEGPIISSRSHDVFLDGNIIE